MKSQSETRRKMAWIIVIIVGLVIGMFIKRVSVGLLIGVVIGLLAISLSAGGKKS